MRPFEITGPNQLSRIGYSFRMTNQGAGQFSQSRRWRKIFYTAIDAGCKARKTRIEHGVFRFEDKRAAEF